MSRPPHPLRPLLRSLLYHGRTHLAVVLCVMAGTAALTGALLVGDSMRGSLRDRALRRLGPIDHALLAPGFFRERLVDELLRDDDFASVAPKACPAILLRGGVHHAETGARANRIDILGVDERFRGLFGGDPTPPLPRSGRSIVLNRSLADLLEAQVGHDVLVRLGRHGGIPVESVLGRRDQTAVSIRLTVAAIVPDDGIGGFGLRPDQYAPLNAFIPLGTLQKTLDQPDRVNALLIVAGSDHPSPPGPRGREAEYDRLQSGFLNCVRLEDYGLRLRRDDDRGYLAVETDRLLIEPPVEDAALGAAASLHLPAGPVLTYLANTIARVEEAQSARIIRQIPYSTITALPPALLTPALGPGEILLNQWAADDLGAKPGDTILIEYYVARPDGRLDTRSARFTLAAIVPMGSRYADPGLMPPYPGISDASSVADWDPPASFRIDLSRIRDQDEHYWKQYQGSPKAFVSLETGRRLWMEADRRFGQSTAVMIRTRPEQGIDTLAARYDRALRAYLDPARLGLVLDPVRRRAVEAAAGSTDFSQLFIAFSFFIIAASAMLVALVFRLGTERRAPEIGLLLATGYSPKQVARQFILEGALIADVGAFLGLAGGIGYAWLMLAGLRSVDWWAEAVHAPFLELHVSWGSLLIGYAASFAIALGSIAGSVRGLTRQSPRSLLAGAIQSGRAAASPHRTRRAWMLLYGSLLCGVGALMSALATDAIPEVYAFFTGGTALLIAGLAGASLWLQDDRHLPIRSTGPGTLVRLGLRNAARCRGRSLTTMALIACSTFVIIAVGASRHEAGHEAQARQGGTGGFTLMGEAAIPLPYNLNTPTGRDALNVGAEAARLLDNSKCVSLRMRPGDDTSCLNLYRAGRPKILGASEEMIERGGFSFSRSLAETTAEAANPWRLLDRTFQDGAVPMIGDANTLQYLLKIGLGDALTLTDERGRERRLRVVGMLSGSVLQGALVIAERRFTGLFPSISGHGFLLIEAPPESSEALARALERDLGGYDLDVVSTLRQLNTYRAVENTYMSTFQALGGLGLMLGTLGLGAILLRNVFDRRGELALLRALGFRPARLMGMVLVENAALLIGGVGIGSLAALLAVAPHMVDRAEQIPWPSLAGTLLIVIGVGLVAGTVALVASFKTPLLPALRTE